MASIDFLLGAAFKDQTTRGTATSMPAIGSGSGTGGAINSADGAVLGVDGSGVGDSGIGFQLAKNVTEKAVITGSFTRNFANYLGRTVESFSVVVPLQGNGGTASSPVTSGDFAHHPGIESLWRAAGVASTATASGNVMTPTATALVTAALYYGDASSNGGRIIVRDVECRSASIELTAGQTGTITFDLLGVFDSYDQTGSWPASPFEYGTQATLSAPVTQAVGFAWGPDTPVDREIGFSTFTATIANEFEEVPSSNAANGVSQRQTGRTMTVSATIDAESTGILYELDQLGESDIANAEALDWQVGTTATAGDTINAISFAMADPELVSLTPNRLGNAQAWDVELVGRASTANQEFSLIYR
jgi:hypothetical protein